MDQKEILLNETNTRLNDLGFGSLNDLSLLDTLLAREILAIGTAQDEIYFTIQDVKDMVSRQKEQTAGMNMSYRKKEIYRYYIPGSDDAVIAIILHYFWKSMLRNWKSVFVLQLFIKTNRAGNGVGIIIGL